MIIVNVQGGLGNQISQYAFSRLMKKLYPAQDILLDATWCTEHPPGFELAVAFEGDRLRFDEAGEKEIRTVTHQYHYSAAERTFLDKLHNRTVKALQNARKCNPVVRQVIQSGYPVDEKVFTLEQDRSWYLLGFWHNYDYCCIIEQLQDELRYREFTEPHFDAVRQQIKEVNSVGVHMRFGDYLGTEHDILPGSRYYQNAARYMAKTTVNPNFFLFTDDTEQATRYWQAMGLEHPFFPVASQGRPAYTDMILMSDCRHNIVANSTFSYWAAMLNRNPGKICTLPDHYAKGRRMWTNALCETIPIDKEMDY